jgi:NADH:ubiquinone oxidoreductase subunit 6 (subunit J)
MTLAQDFSDIFGKISPPPGSPGGGDPVVGLSKIISVGLQIFLIVAAVMMLVLLLWGGLDWIASGGEKEKLSKAQNKLFNAVLGMLIIISAFTIFTLITGTVLGNKIIDTSGGGWRLIIPTIAP